MFFSSHYILSARVLLVISNDDAMTWGTIIDWIIKNGIPVAIIVLGAVLIYHIAGFIIKRMVLGYTKRRANRVDVENEEQKKRAVTLGSFIKSVVLVVIIIAVLILVLNLMGVNLAVVLGSLGIVALGISLAMQGLIKDFINGFFIIIDDYYHIGDIVTIAGRNGTVERIDLRKTTLRDQSGVVHIIPNSLVDVSSNETRGFSRINLDITVGYGEDLNIAINTINDVCAELSRDFTWKSMLLSAPHVLRVEVLGDYGINIKIVGDTRPGAHSAVMGELRLRLKNEFDKRHIEIPWPTHKIYFGNKA